MRAELCLSNTCEDMENITIKYIFEMERLTKAKFKIEKLINKLKKQDRQICLAYYYYNIYYKKIVEKYNISTRTFMRKLKTIKELWNTI